MSTKSSRQRAQTGAGHGVICVGMSLIVAATVLNIAYDQLPRMGAYAMPTFLSHMYDSSGKTYVTTIFVALGLSAILLGAALSGRGPELRAPDRTRVTSTLPLFSPAADDEDESDRTSSGTVVLRTRKYIPTDSGSSAVTDRSRPHRS